MSNTREAEINQGPLLSSTLRTWLLQSLILIKPGVPVEVGLVLLREGRLLEEVEGAEATAGG